MTKLLPVTLAVALAAGAAACGAILGFNDGTPIENESGADSSAEAGGNPGVDASVDGAADAKVDGSSNEGGADAGPKQAFESAILYNGRLDAPSVPGTGGLAAADARCMEEAQATFPGRTFVAWMSTTGTSAKSRLAGGGPWYVRTALLGTLTELTSGGLHVMLDKIPDGGPASSNVGVWTGTEANGTPNSAQCSNWTSIDVGVSAEVGSDQSVNDHWTYSTLRTCELTYHLYCFEK